jgi:hypothetical protein
MTNEVELVMAKITGTIKNKEWPKMWPKREGDRLTWTWCGSDQIESENGTCSVKPSSHLDVRHFSLSVKQG